MLRRNKGKLIASSAVILLPMLVGMLLWDRLPQNIVMHWNASGEPTGQSSRAMAVFALPLILLALHWLCLWVTGKDPKNAGQTPKAFRIVIWVIPAVSVALMGFAYFIALGQAFSALRLMNLMFGVLFLVMGNFMPKFKQNYTMGIKIRWTLRSEENWNATHRFAGKVWCVCGLVLLLAVFLPEQISVAVLLLAILPAVALPVLYSWRFHRAQVASGNPPADTPPTAYEKTGKRIAVVLLPVVAVILAVLLFTGNIHAECTEEYLQITASFHEDASVAYTQMDSVEYRPEGVPGTRVMGFGSARLLLGTFENQEFGLYTRYTYTGSDSAIVITSGDRVLVLSAEDAEATQALYQQLLLHTGN